MNFGIVLQIMLPHLHWTAIDGLSDAIYDGVRSKKLCLELYLIPCAQLVTGCCAFVAKGTVISARTTKQ